MPIATALEIDLSDEQREYLERTVRRRTATQREVMRARIVLLAAAGASNHEIARRLECSRYTVWQWRKRFFEEGLDGLTDRPRPGRPRRFSPSATS